MGAAAARLGPPLPLDFTLWLVNRFGDAFIVTDDGAASMLDVGAGSLQRLADNRDHFCDLLDVDNNADVRLMIPLVDECVAAGMTLAAHQRYGFKIPPVLVMQTIATGRSLGSVRPGQCRQGNPRGV